MKWRERFGKTATDPNDYYLVNEKDRVFFMVVYDPFSRVWVVEKRGTQDGESMWLTMLPTFFTAEAAKNWVEKETK
jgi:hypothetical protein